MSACHLIDTFPAFLAYWTDVQNSSLDAQIESWASEYMSRWPELLEKQLDDYASQGLSWRRIARERIFPFLNEWLPTMKIAHQNLLRMCRPVHSRAQKVLGLELDVLFAIYVGIGCGAGWATRFCGSPAVLIGLENVAECGWSRPRSIGGLVTHEIGHLAHDHWRVDNGKSPGSGPWWQLYREGFAQWCEHTILGRDTWHMVGDEESGSRGCDDWLEWCQEHRGWLTAEFLRVVDGGESTRPFFGSWFEICGRRQCGYFLGHELIRYLQLTCNGLKEIALLEDVEERGRAIMGKIAGQGVL